MAINATTGAGKAFLRSIYELYASWGLDFGTLRLLTYILLMILHCHKKPYRKSLMKKFKKLISI